MTNHDVTRVDITAEFSVTLSYGTKTNKIEIKTPMETTEFERLVAMTPYF